MRRSFCWRWRKRHSVRMKLDRWWVKGEMCSCLTVRRKFHVWSCRAPLTHMHRVCFVQEQVDPFGKGFLMRKGGDSLFGCGWWQSSLQRRRKNRGEWGEIREVCNNNLRRWQTRHLRWQEWGRDMLVDCILLRIWRHLWELWRRVLLHGQLGGMEWWRDYWRKIVSTEITIEAWANFR